MEAFRSQLFLYPNHYFGQFSLGIFAVEDIGLGGGESIWDHQLAARDAVMAICIARTVVFGPDRCLHGALGGA